MSVELAYNTLGVNPNNLYYNTTSIKNEYFGVVDR